MLIFLKFLKTFVHSDYLHSLNYHSNLKLCIQMKTAFYFSHSVCFRIIYLYILFKEINLLTIHIKSPKRLIDLTPTLCLGVLYITS